MDGFPPNRNHRQSNVVVISLRCLNLRDGEENTLRNITLSRGVKHSEAFSRLFVSDHINRIINIFLRITNYLILKNICICDVAMATNFDIIL